MTTLSPPPRRRPPSNSDSDRLREQLACVAAYVRTGKLTRSCDAFDLETDRLVGDMLCGCAQLLDAYDDAQMGKAAGLLNLTAEASESAGLDESTANVAALSCIGGLPRGRTSTPCGRHEGRKRSEQGLIGTQTTEPMSAKTCQRAARRDIDAMSVSTFFAITQEWFTTRPVVANGSGVRHMGPDEPTTGEAPTSGSPRRYRDGANQSGHQGQRAL